MEKGNRMAKFILPSVELLTIDNLPINAKQVYKFIERVGRVCYKSEGAICEGSAEKFVENLITRGHESVIEHVSISARFIIDRGVSHELVRHRLASFSQVSQRYVNYTTDKFGNELTFVVPQKLMKAYQSYIGAFDAMPFERLPYDEQHDLIYFMSTCGDLEKVYQNLIEFKWAPQDARTLLPNCTQTEINATANLREWRHILALRTSPAAHPDMRYVMRILQEQLQTALPLVFK